MRRYLKVPQLAAVMGPCVAGGAYLPALSDLIIMVVLGGMGSLFGPIIGSVALLVLEEALSRVTEYWQIILGPLLLGVVLYARGGIEGLLAGPGRD